MRPLFTFIGGLIFLGALILDGSTFHLERIHLFFNIQSGLIVFGGSFFLSWALIGFKEIGEAVSVAYSSQKLKYHHALPHLHTLTTLCTLILSLGCFGVLVGMINTLQNLSDPTKIGPAMAVILLSTLYSVSLSEVLIRPLISRIYSQQSTYSSTSPLKKFSGIIVISTVMVALFGFGVILFSVPK